MIEEKLFFTSETVTLEGRISYCESTTVPPAKVLLCPPHPFLGGDMDNNIIRTLTHTLTRNGCLVFRFNYRGIGGSGSDRDLQQDQKEFWENSTCPDYEAKIHTDCHSALQELNKTLQPEWPVFIIGYSFGCLPAIALTAGNNIKKLVLISPPLAKWKVSIDQMRQDMPKAIFFSSNDFACPEDEVHAFYRRLGKPKLIRAFPDAEHFFIGKEVELADAIDRFLVQ